MAKIKDKERRNKSVKLVQQRINNRKGGKTYDDVMDMFILETLLPLLHGGFSSIRKSIADKSKGGVVHVENLPTSFNMAYALLALIEPEVEKLAKKIKKY